MPRALSTPTGEIARLLPDNWATAEGSALDTLKADVKSGLHEILLDRGYKCNGSTKAVDSVATTVRERIRALAIVRRVEIGVQELATDKGVDINTASRATITAASSADEINALIAFESLISQATISLTVTNREMAVIEQEEISDSRSICDPGWSKDITQFVERAVPHGITRGVSIVAEDGSVTGLFIVETVGILLDTIRAEVDDNGEVNAWIYEEPEVVV